MLENDYEPRPIRLIDRWTLEGVQLKVYSIAHGRDVADSQLVEAAKRIVAQQLKDRPTRQTHYGVGFVGVHDGRGENQIFLDQWVNQNELLHTYWISSKDDPTNLVRAGDDHNSVCVWDLFVQCFERQAWVEEVIGNARGADLDAYMRRAFDGMA